MSGAIGKGRPARRSSTITFGSPLWARPSGAPIATLSPTLTSSEPRLVIAVVQPPPWSMMTIRP
jgi:hypothetical protein